MNLITKLLSSADILLDVGVTSKKRVFEQAGLLFENNHGIARDKVFDSLFARERLGSTGLGQQVAVPHGRIQGLRTPIAALVRVQDPIPFEAPDGQLVKLLVFLLVPENANQHHLNLLSELAQMLSDPLFREKLFVENNPEAVHKLVEQWTP